MRLPLIGLVSILTINIIGLFYGWYDFSWFDIVLHYLGGFFVSLFFYSYLYKHFLPNSKITNTLILVGATIFIGVTWEFAEYIAGQVLQEPIYSAFKTRVYFMGDLDDTVTDLLMDILGGVTTACLFLRTKLKTR